MTKPPAAAPTSPPTQPEPSHPEVKEFKPNLIKDLPEELLSHAYSYLGAEEAARVALVSRASNEASQSPLIWKAKYQQHFPHRYGVLVGEKNCNWRVEFSETYWNAHQKYYLDPAQRRLFSRLFSLVKEGDLKGLQAQEALLPNSIISTFDITDNDGRSFLRWAKKTANQKVLNYFYKLVKKRYNNRHLLLGEQPLLYYAVSFKQPLKQINLLISRGSSFEEEFFQHLKPIHVAACADHLAMMQVLISNDATVLNETLYDETPLIIATEEGNLASVSYLAEQKGINLDAAKKNGATAMHLAARQGESEILAKLLDAKATATLGMGPDKSQPIHIAAEEGQLTVTEVLISSKPELINEVDGQGRTPLMLAAGRGYVSLANYLLEEKSINLNIVDSHDSSVFDYAHDYLHSSLGPKEVRQNKYNQLVKALLRHGAFVSLKQRIEKAYLDEQTQTEVELHQYIMRKKEQPVKPPSTLSGHIFSFFKPKELAAKKLAAASALKEVINGSTKKSALDSHKKMLATGDLSSIYRRLQLS